MSFMRDILKRHSGTHSGTPFFASKLPQNCLFLCGGENTKDLLNKAECAFIAMRSCGVNHDSFP